MVNQSLVSYINDTLKKGYTYSQVRDYLIKSGYAQADVDEALDFVKKENEPAKKISVKTMISLAAVIAAIAVIIVVALMLIQEKPDDTATIAEPNLKLILSMTNNKVDAGNVFSFDLNVNNLGGGSTSVNIVNQLIDRNGDVKSTQTDFFYTKDQTKKSYIIKIPSTLSTGEYTIKSTAEYGNKRAQTTENIEITKKEATQTEEESCYDGIKNQGEFGIDCGGPCQSCDITTGCGNCNDGNLCTTDKCENNKCVNEVIHPCCGNNRCEVGEDYQSCRADCEAPPKQEAKDMTPSEVIESVSDVAKSDPTRSGKMCEELLESRDRDVCFSNIAEAIQEKIFCSYVEGVTRKDACYMNNFALNGDYSVCSEITNSYYKRACIQLNQLEKVGQ